MLVLVVDSNEPSRSVLELQLRQLGVLAMGASHLQEALQILRASAVDVVLMASQQPGEGLLNDWQALRDTAGKKSRFIGITPNPQSQALLELQAAGLTEFLPSDLDTELLGRTLAAAPPATGSDSPGVEECPLMDHTRLEDLLDIAQISGADAVRTILDTFFKSSEERLEQMQQALQADDEATLRRIRHGWAGIAGSLGAMRLTDSLKRLDPVEMLNSSAHRKEVLSRLKSEFEDTRAFFDAFTRGLKQS
jgi:CheY-like chemotaxis protein